jgi:hypothetical protein
MKQIREAALLSIALVAVSVESKASDWGVVGAGNAQCKIWSTAKPSTKAQIFAWIHGFATSESLSRAAAGRPRFRLELMTDQYLEHEITTACASLGSESDSMVSIAIKMLSRFPTNGK